MKYDHKKLERCEKWRKAVDDKDFVWYLGRWNHVPIRMTKELASKTKADEDAKYELECRERMNYTPTHWRTQEDAKHDVSAEIMGSESEQLRQKPTFWDRFTSSIFR